MDDIIMIWLNYNLPLVIVKTFFSEIYFLEPMNPYSVSGILLRYQNWLSLNSFWVNITTELPPLYPSLEPRSHSFTETLFWTKLWNIKPSPIRVLSKSNNLSTSKQFNKSHCRDFKASYIQCTFNEKNLIMEEIDTLTMHLEDIVDQNWQKVMNIIHIHI